MSASLNGKATIRGSDRLESHGNILRSLGIDDAGGFVGILERAPIFSALHIVEIEFVTGDLDEPSWEVIFEQADGPAAVAATGVMPASKGKSDSIVIVLVKPLQKGGTRGGSNKATFQFQFMWGNRENWSSAFLYDRNTTS